MRLQPVYNIHDHHTEYLSTQIFWDICPEEFTQMLERNFKFVHHSAFDRTSIIHNFDTVFFGANMTSYGWRLLLTSVSTIVIQLDIVNGLNNHMEVDYTHPIAVYNIETNSIILPNYIDGLTKTARLAPSGKHALITNAKRIAKNIERKL